MPELPVFLRPEARSDLMEIYRFIADRSGYPDQPWRFVQRIRANCDKIGRPPYAGRPRDDLRPGLRTVPFERSTVIAYQVLDDAVEIVNVFYGGRDYEALFSDGNSDT
jgi:toxin ParE1/3/4